MTSRILILGLLSGLFCSCSSVSHFSKFNKNDPKINELSDPKINDLKKGGTPPIVEVKKESLKKTKTGEEQVLAYNSKTKKSKSGKIDKNGKKTRKAPAVGEFFAPDEFDAGALPTSAGFPSLGLLPPLKSGGSSSIESAESIEHLSTEPKAPQIVPISFATE